ncbi:Secondary metabolism regulator LAE1 like protein [Verticillium longisporum]|uniref:Secondary metabolism regulator LAE1 like protein n=2 Tax=Verticillium TaxID=1036719 RepID=A0A0G4NH65_VERLO|nr:Putative sterigmatocystin biosynthesis monooxygenase stcW [Verticillium dahliae VDG2]KAF3355486.1 NADH-ubiquinone oxidoreductase 10.5 kDa subunit [Verticillium dahliae VDG1]KAG7108438.1 Secondary metabolism regulator LAE1 like protein [Verticillium longisporum]KAH6686488.1 S-adenosyl-L-methionine-dependent methyltransferase [Verticillium dahliae]KAG7117785.1 Secondary metabolism regulator LAE1 like protein [Verticillium longisporum]
MASSAEAPATAAAADSPAASPPTGSPPPAQAPAQAANIQVDAAHERDDQTDDGFEDGLSSTASVTDSVLEYRKIHGRTFHNFKSDTEYWGPNDDKQNEHLDINHEMLLMAMDNRLHVAPISGTPQRVLDVGTGTGIWAIDFADQYPSAEVIGTDLSPIQPAWVPSNCRFELDDAQLPWTFPDNHFDYIHMRLLMGAIKDWPFLYSEVYRCLKPGGWFEHMDYDPHIYSDDGSLSPTSAWNDYGGFFIKAGEKLGRTFNIIMDKVNHGWMKDAGFVNVDELRLKLPMGAWPADPKLKEVGKYNLVATEQGLEGFMLYILTNVHQWDIVQAQTYIAAVRSELKKRSNHAYYVASATYGQKPE